MSSVPGPVPLPPNAWQRLHAALMPDYNRKATAVWWLFAVTGWLVLAWSLVSVAQQGWMAGLAVAIGTALAVGAGLFPVRVPGTKNSYAAGEVFIFLLLLMLGPQAAAVAAACETGVGSLRTSKRWTSRLYGPAVAALSMTLAGGLFRVALDALSAAGGLGSVAAELALAMACSALYFLLTATLMYGVLQLKRGEAFFQPTGIFGVFRWVGMAYAGSASLAALLHFAAQQQGLAALLVMLPLLAMLLVSLHFYFQQQEATAQLRESHAALADREARQAQREAEAAAQHLRELQASERRFHGAFTRASIGMALLAPDGRILQANPALAQALGRSVESLLAQRLQDHAATEERAQLDRHLAAATAAGFQGFAGEMRFLTASGNSLWLALHGSDFTEPGSAETCLILQVQDVSARRAAEAGLAHMAFHDGLTGLPNRRRFMQDLAAAVGRTRSDPARAWAVIFLDFDGFKVVNDSLGHGVGDELLQQLAQRLQSHLRPSDLLARLGGDEFAILIGRLEDERDAELLAQRLLAALRPAFSVAGHAVTTSASLGITSSSLRYASADEVLRDADAAMYRAKGEGKARYAVFDASLRAEVSAQAQLHGELRQAFARGELAVHYQPVFGFVPGKQATRAGGGPAAAADFGPAPRLAGFEALVRWQRPDGSTWSPPAFLPLAEAAGLMVPLSDFVLRHACRQLAAWQRSSPALAGLTVSVNLSSGDLAEPALAARVGRALAEAGLRAEHLTLELAEGSWMGDIAGGLDALRDLRGLGVRLAVDDFGTGFSSLSHLSRLPIDSLKIDRSFVARMGRNRDDAAVVAAILQLGSTLHKAVVAEGIETADQLAQLRELGCELGQGFHLAHPLSAQAATAWLAGGSEALH